MTDRACLGKAYHALSAHTIIQILLPYNSERFCYPMAMNYVADGYVFAIDRIFAHEIRVEIKIFYKSLFVSPLKTLLD